MKKHSQRALAVLLAGAMSLSVTAAASNNSVTVTLDGKPLTTAGYVDKHDRTQIPASVAEQLGVSVSLKAGEAAGDTFVVDGYVPLRYVFEAKGYGLSWDGATRTAALTSPVSAFAKLPTLVYAELEDLMAKQAEQYVTPDNVVPMLWQGLLEMDVKVGESETRTAKLYVPDGTPQGAMFVAMNVPEGQDTYTFMKESGWMELADQEEFCLFVLEPKAGESWGSAEDEAAYVNAAIGAARAGKYLQPGPSIYLVGYGAVGADLEKYAMDNPIAVAGGAFLDAEGITADYVRKNGDVSFDTQTKTYGVTRKEVPVPVLLCGKADKAAVDYWKAAAQDKNAEARFIPEGLKDFPTLVVEDSKSYDYASADTSKAVWAFLDQFYRYGGGVLSNAISKKVDYKAMGVEFKSFTDSEGTLRQYLVYLPESAKKLDKVPVVIAYHGASTSMRNYFENTLWYNIADEEGIMLVFPESTLVPVPPTLGGGEANPTAYRALWQVENPELRLTDVVYADELLDDLETNYPQMDLDRIYCTGHSMGCMMTHYLGSTAVSSRFAAMGATSGPLMAKEDSAEEIVPMFMTFAEYDLWQHDLSNDETSKMHNNAVDMWLIQNGLATEENVAQVRQKADKSYTEGRFQNQEWKNDQGLTLFRYALVEKKDHVNLPLENRLLWDEWFSHWTKTADGSRAFDGTAIR